MSGTPGPVHPIQGRVPERTSCVVGLFLTSQGSARPLLEAHTLVFPSVSLRVSTSCSFLPSLLLTLPGRANPLPSLAQGPARCPKAAVGFLSASTAFGSSPRPPPDGKPTEDGAAAFAGVSQHLASRKATLCRLDKQMNIFKRLLVRSIRTNGARRQGFF